MNEEAWRWGVLREGVKSLAVWQTSSGNDPRRLCFHPVKVHRVCLCSLPTCWCALLSSSLYLCLPPHPSCFLPPRLSLPLLPPFLLLPVLPSPASPPSLPACQMSGAVASEWAVEGSVAAASIWSCNGVKKSGLTDRRQSHRASLKTDPLDKEIIERRRQLGGPSAFLDVFIFFSLLVPSYYVH